MSKFALLIVDMQKGVCVPEAYDLKHTISQILRLIFACRAFQAHVIYIRQDDGEGSLITKGSEGYEIIDEFTPGPTDYICDKKFNSAFKGTRLNGYLKRHGFDTLIISGMQTEHCIDATIKSAFEHGYDVIVANESTTTIDTDEISASTLRNFYENHVWNNRYAKVLDVHDIIELM